MRASSGRVVVRIALAGEAKRLRAPSGPRNALQPGGNLSLISSRQAKAAAPARRIDTAAAAIQRRQWTARRGGEIAGNPALQWDCGRITKSGTGRSSGRGKGEAAGAASTFSNQRWLQRAH